MKKLNEIKKRLNEFGTKEFNNIKKNRKISKNDNNEYWRFAREGFMLARMEDEKKDGILSSIPSDYSDEDLIKAVKKNSDESKEELVEQLAYFLCGYDHFCTIKKDIEESKPKIPISNFLDQSMWNLSKKESEFTITEKELEEKKDFILQVFD